MGDYAYRKCDGEEIKIGTCGAMYYVTWEQWKNGEIYGKDASNIKEYIDTCTFRLPLYEEEGILPGDFDYNGYLGAEPIRVYFKHEYKDEKRTEFSDFYKEIGAICQENYGNIQMTKSLGMRNEKGYGQFEENVGIYASAPCYHGFPGELPKGIFYNGLNSNVLAVFGVGIRKGRARAIIGCVACGDTVFSTDYDEFVREFGCMSIHEHKQDWDNLLSCLKDMDEWANENCKQEVKNGN